MNTYKPEGYNSLSPYLIVDQAQQLVDQLKVVFQAEVLRQFQRENGKIAHVELKLDDSVVMISDSTEEYPAHLTMLHMYVPDVHQTFQRALENGCRSIDPPRSQEGDPDTRGSFYDCSGNYWSVSTQMD